MPKHKPLTKAEQLIIKKQFPNTYTQLIADQLGCSYATVANHAKALGVKKSAAFRAQELKRQGDRLTQTGKNTRFTKGMVSANKGQKMPAHVYEKSKGTMFKKGQKPHNAVAIGTETIRKDRGGRPYIMIKVKKNQPMVHKHVLLWQKHHRKKLPKGHNIVFKDGNTLNCNIENLECISNAQLMQRNTIHRYPKELKQSIRLVNKLKKRIHAKEQN